MAIAAAPREALIGSHANGKSACEFIISAADRRQFPPESGEAGPGKAGPSKDGPGKAGPSKAGPGEAGPGNDGPVEIAFLGRSNVGKSSLLNSLVRQPGLAFTSSKPGCTQLINFYKIDERVRFVDLPGYGYARVSLDEKARWRKLIESYLLERRRLALSFLLIDARRGWMDMDLELKAWLESHNRRYQVIVTKVDKLKSNNQLKAGMALVRRELKDQEPVPFSAIDSRGVREIWQIISKIKNKQ